MPKTASPLRYPGGKTQFYDSVLDIITKNGLIGCTYIEPFVGGAGVALRLLFENKVQRIIINDFDKAIYSFWYSILHHGNRFCDKIVNTPVNIDEWKRQRDLYETTNDVFLLGFATFFLNRTNRSGIIMANPIGGINQDGNFLIDCRYNKNDLIKKIRKIMEYSNFISVTNVDAEDFIKMNNGKKNAFWFIDPPYYKNGKNLYKNFYGHNDHVSLSSAISKSLANCPWILTYDICEEIESIYAGWVKTTIELNYSAQTKCKKMEYLFFNNIYL